MLNIRDVGSAHRYLLSWSDIHGFVVSSIHNILRPAPQKLNVVAPMRRVDYKKILAQGADWTARYAYELEARNLYASYNSGNGCRGRSKSWIAIS